MPEKIVIEVVWPDDETIEKIGGHLNDEYLYEITKLPIWTARGRKNTRRLNPPPKKVTSQAPKQ